MLTILQGDALEKLRGLPDESVQCCVTSPPYWGLRDYETGAWQGGNTDCDHVFGMTRRDTDRETPGGRGGSFRGETMGFRNVCGKCGAKRIDSQIGLEETPEQYVTKMVEVFREVRRVLKKDGTLWVNLGSSYASGDTRPNQSHGDALACGSDGKARSDFQEIDSSYLDLCDGCRDALLSRTGNTPSLPSISSLRDMKAHDKSRLDYAVEEEVFSPLAAQESTISESSQARQGGCRHCPNCGACLSVLRSSTRDASLCAHRSAYIDGTTQTKPLLANRILGKELSFSAYSTIAFPVFKAKDLIPIPWLVAMALQSDGWYLRSDIIWAKPNPMPESVTDRPTKAHEYLFLLTKSERYYYDAEAIKERASGRSCGNRSYKYSGIEGHETKQGILSVADVEWDDRNRRSVWTVPTAPYAEAHFATFPPDLIKPCILAGSRAGDTILDPFAGSGTTGMVTIELGRKAVLIELNPAYILLIEQRCCITPGFAF